MILNKWDEVVGANGLYFPNINLLMCQYNNFHLIIIIWLIHINQLKDV